MPLDFADALQRGEHLFLRAQDVDVIGEQGFLHGNDHMGGVHGPADSQRGGEFPRQAFDSASSISKLPTVAAYFALASPTAAPGGGCRGHGIGAESFHAGSGAVGSVARRVQPLKGGAPVKVDEQATAEADIADQRGYPAQFALDDPAVSVHITGLLVRAVHERQGALEQFPVLRRVGGVVEIERPAPEFHFHRHGCGNTPQVAVRGVFRIVFCGEILPEGVDELRAEPLRDVSCRAWRSFRA